MKSKNRYLPMLKLFYQQGWLILTAKEPQIDGSLAGFRLKKGIVPTFVEALISASKACAQLVSLVVRMLFVALFLIILLVAWAGISIAAPLWVAWPIFKLRRLESKFRKEVDSALNKAADHGN